MASSQNFEYVPTTGEAAEGSRPGRLERVKAQCSVKEVFIAIFMIFLPFVGSLIGVFLGNRGDNNVWFKTIEKPSWQPPSWLFGPVWSVLYLMMGTASYLVFRAGRNLDRRGDKEHLPYFKDRKVIFVLLAYAVNLILNWVWTPLFFTLHDFLAALVEIVFVWATIVLCMVLFWSYSRVATGLFVPYLLWVSFATALTATLYHLNKDQADGGAAATTVTTAETTSAAP